MSYDDTLDLSLLREEALPTRDSRAPHESRHIAHEVVTRTEPPVVRLRRELEAIMDISRAVSTSLHIDDLLPRIMERTTQLMKADRSTFFIVDRKQGELWSKVIQGHTPEEIRLRIGDGIAGWVAASGQSLNLPDAYDDARFDRTWDEKSGYRTRSLLCVPIRNKENLVVAVIQCLNKERRAFDADDELLLACIGGQCAVAIENAFLYQSLFDKHGALLSAESQLRRANSELEVLYEVEQQIASAADSSGLIDAVLTRFASLLKVEAAALLLVSERGAQSFVHVSHGDLRPVRSLEPRVAQTLLLHARFPILREVDAGGGVADSLFWAEPDLRVREVWSAPLSDGRSQIGVLQVANRTSADRDSEAFLRLLGSVGGQLARGIAARLEREAGERAERLALLGHSVGAILHDMRTPLTAVSGYVELMTDEANQTVRTEHAQRVGRAIEHMEAMTQEVLSFARGQREILVRKVYLDRFVSEVREMLVPELDGFGVKLVVSARYDGIARFDENKLKRVILNLARNACQAMGPGGTFTWTIDRVAEYLVFECQDDGPGIPKELEGRLFESFATHGKEGGTGLGLAMAKKIVDAHCGHIEVRSSPLHGAVFRIEIPV
jgi:signal transduction histidine kinase/putative methionine-R-sulfoxide reductase with GAF domain